MRHWILLALLGTGGLAACAGDDEDKVETGDTGTDPMPTDQQDNDGDGLTNEEEATLGTDPDDDDTDDDGLSDGDEVNTHETDPLVADTDGDGLSDGNEVNTTNTDPNVADSDGDGLSDGEEVNTTNTDPNVEDTDGDGLTDGDEVNTTNTDPTLADTDTDDLTDGDELNVYGTDPNVVDTDGDRLSDGDEVNVHGTDPTLDDTDNDGLLDGDELDTTNTDPTLADTDGDGLSDGDEVNTTLTDPTVADTDGDGLSDGDEVNTTLTDPTLGDTDGDGLSDGDEVNTTGTNPLVNDTDGDGLPDGEEVNTTGTNPLLADTDGDGLDDNTEVNTTGTNPQAEDTDGDGLPDGVEVNTTSTDPNESDTDSDGLSDGAEVNTHNSDPLVADTDGDGLSDGDEVNVHGSDPTLVDTDGDMLSDSEEVNGGTAPGNPDTDSDGLSDGEEVNTTNTDPLAPDSDSDGLTDGDEVNVHGSDPNVPDTDADGLTDGDEVDVHGTNPTLTDTDGDTLADGTEVNDTGTDPALADTDADGLDDGREINTTSTDPLLADSDADGLLDGAEVDTFGTDPLVPDTDADTLSDGDEVNVYGTDPLNVDTDGDTLTDGREVNETGTDPTLVDTDADGLDDAVEVDTLGTDPTNPDSDADGLTDGDEIDIYGTDPLNQDTDADGLFDGDEVNVHGTDPFLADTDGDTLSDGDEVNLYGTDPVLADTDADGLDDGTEIDVTLTDPLLDDTDDDRLLDGEEVNFTGTDPLNPDTDADGLDDGSEVIRSTDPFNPDTDGDGLLDGDEVNNSGTDPLNPDTDSDGLGDGVEIQQYGTDPTLADTDAGGVDDQDELRLGTDPLDGTDDFDNQPLFFDDFESGMIDASWTTQLGEVLYDTAFVNRGGFAIRFAGGGTGTTASFDTSACTSLGVTGQFASGNPNTVETGEPFVFRYFDGVGFVDFFSRDRIGATPYETEAVVITDVAAMNATFSLQFENFGTIGNFDHQHIDDLSVFCDPDTADADGDGVANWLDCDDVSPLHQSDCGLCIDLDGDDYGVDCDAGPDCDDGDATINPGATDPFGDGIDSDCSSVDGPGLFDGFETGAPLPMAWASLDDVFAAGAGANTGSFGLLVNGAGGTAITQNIDMTACPTISWSVAVQEVGATMDPGDVFQVSYWDGAVWRTVERVFADDAPTFTTLSGNIEGGPTANFAMRFLNNSDTTADDLFIDDVVIACGGPDADGDGFETTNDCDDTNPDLWASCGVCVDVDLDGYGDGCDRGPDCNDADPLVNPAAVETLADQIDSDCSGTDGPGLADDFEFGIVSPTTFEQVDGPVNESATAFSGLSSVELNGRSEVVTATVDTTSCVTLALTAEVGSINAEVGDDLVFEYWDGTSWLEAARTTSADPVWTTILAPLTDPNAFRADLRVRIRNLGLATATDAYLVDDFFVGCSGVDGDQDGFGTDVDCDDADPQLWSACATCIDTDGDGRGIECDLGEDCDDTDPTAFPGAVDIPGDGIDQNCTGVDGPDFADDFEAGGAGRHVGDLLSVLRRGPCGQHRLVQHLDVGLRRGRVVPDRHDGLCGRGLGVLRAAQSARASRVRRRPVPAVVGCFDVDLGAGRRGARRHFRPHVPRSHGQHRRPECVGSRLPRPLRDVDDVAGARSDPGRRPHGDVRVAAAPAARALTSGKGPRRAAARPYWSISSMTARANVAPSVGLLIQPRAPASRASLSSARECSVVNTSNLGCSSSSTARILRISSNPFIPGMLRSTRARLIGGSLDLRSESASLPFEAAITSIDSGMSATWTCWRIVAESSTTRTRGLFACIAWVLDSSIGPGGGALEGTGQVTNRRANRARTAGLPRTTSVNTPRMVPSGNDSRFTADMTEMSRRLRHCDSDHPDHTLSTPHAKMVTAATPNSQAMPALACCSWASLGSMAPAAPPSNANTPPAQLPIMVRAPHAYQRIVSTKSWLVSAGESSLMGHSPAVLLSRRLQRPTSPAREVFTGCDASTLDTLSATPTRPGPVVIS